MKNAKPLAVIFLLGFAGPVFADLPEIAGVVGMTIVPEDAYVAVWLPVPDGQALAGVRWYNNDAAVAFPQVLVASGTADVAAALESGSVAATDVQGVSSGWSEVTFVEPYVSQSGGLHCLFLLPAGSEYEASGYGGGAAFGYTGVGLGHPSWLCAEGEMWMKIGADAGLAVEPIMVPALPGMVSLSLPHQPGMVVVQAPQMKSAHPNPFNPQTVLEYSLPEPLAVDLSIFDISGRLVRRLEQGVQSAGTHSATWQGDDDQGRRLASGTYLARFVAGRVQQTQRLVLVK